MSPGPVVSSAGITYPTRARIIDVTGRPDLRTPEASRAHIGKEGLATMVEEVVTNDDGSPILCENGHSWTFPNVTIMLDDGGILHGYECWWEPIS